MVTQQQTIVLKKWIGVTLWVIPVVATGHPIPSRVIANADPPRYTHPRCPPARNLTVVVCKQSVPTCIQLGVINCFSRKENTRLPLHYRSWSSQEGGSGGLYTNMAGYKLFHIPRPSRRGGGVVILVKDGISIVWNKLPHLTDTTFEHIETFDYCHFHTYQTCCSVQTPLILYQQKTLKYNLLRGLVILCRSCRHAAVDYYIVEISTWIEWIGIIHV